MAWPVLVEVKTVALWLVDGRGRKSRKSVGSCSFSPWAWWWRGESPVGRT